MLKGVMYVLLLFAFA